MFQKSLNRFYIVGLALAAILVFFGVKQDHVTIHKTSKTLLTSEVYSIHSTCPCHQPFEIENKEEQPTTEDDESLESTVGDIANNSVSFTNIHESIDQPDQLSLSKSQTHYHTPAYVRLRSILI